MGKVRPFAEADIPAVADLFTRVFPLPEPVAPDALRSYFAEVFFHSPWCDSALPSLVYQESDGTIVGFLGVVPRRLLMNGRPIRLAVSFHFMVEPGSRATLAAVEILKSYLSGPQDLSLTDGAGDAGRKLWEGFGGSTAPLYSLRWTRPLRPTRYVLSLLARRRGLAPFAWAARPAGWLVDGLAVRMRASPFSQKAQAPEEKLSEDTLEACLRDFPGGLALRPDYDRPTLQALLQRAAGRRSQGVFRKVAVRSPAGEILGWYLYYLQPGGISNVIQLAARESSIATVLQHLFYHAWRQGSTAVSGRVEPRFLLELVSQHCLLQRGSWMLLHSPHAAILEAIRQGDAFLTELEGEWCLVGAS